MVSYGLHEDEDSFDSSFERPQPRKRSYPVAFPQDERTEEVTPYRNTVGVAQSEEWLPTGLSVQSVMECFTTALGWMRYALVEYGGKFFTSGMGIFWGRVG